MNRFLVSTQLMSAGFVLAGLAACGGGGGSSLDTTPPAEVKLVSASAGEDSVVLQWTDPANGDYDHAEVIWSPFGTILESVAKGVQTLTATGLAENQEYPFIVRTVDHGGNTTAGAMFSITTRPAGATDVREYRFIYSAADLNAIRGGVAGYPEWTLDKSYLLMADLDLAGWGNWIPIAHDTDDMDSNFTGPHFTGGFDGNGHAIDHLTIDRTTSDFNGLFGMVAETAILKNLGLRDVQIEGRSYNGALVGCNYGARITHCYSTGVVANSLNQSGGLVGQHTNHGTITDCRSSVAVACGSSAGGLVGRMEVAEVARSFAVGAVSGTNPQSDAGGLVGSVSLGTISDCYAIGNVAGADNVGGLAGHLTQSSAARCYATGSVACAGAHQGGLVGQLYNSNTIDAAFYDSQTTGQSDTGKGTPKTTAEMKTEGTFTGWIFPGVWTTGTLNTGYPYLQTNHPTE
jgi:hypothetical protein